MRWSEMEMSWDETWRIGTLMEMMVLRDATLRVQEVGCGVL